MRARAVDKALRNGPLTHGQKAAVKLILAAEDRTVGVQGYAGSGKTTMLNRARALLQKKGYAVRGLAPSASAARTLAAEAGIESETLQRFLVRYNGVAGGRMTSKGQKEMRAAFAKAALIVDEGSLASTVQARDLLRIADSLRIPRVVLVGCCSAASFDPPESLRINTLPRRSASKLRAEQQCIAIDCPRRLHPSVDRVLMQRPVLAVPVCPGRIKDHTVGMQLRVVVPAGSMLEHRCGYIGRQHLDLAVTVTDTGIPAMTQHRLLKRYPSRIVMRPLDLRTQFRIGNSP